MRPRFTPLLALLPTVAAGTRTELAPWRKADETSDPAYVKAEAAHNAYLEALAHAPFGTAQRLAVNALYESALRTGYDAGDKTSIKTGRFHSYENYLATHLLPMRLQPIRFLEIGLGCNMNYGAGRSLKLWVDLLPAAQIWMAEYNEKCLKAKAAEISALAPGRMHLLVGSQADPVVLARWSMKANSSSDSSGGNGGSSSSGSGGGDSGSRGPWHFIIDDGSHVATHQWETLVGLWPMLAPGGVFAVEDMGETKQEGNARVWRAGGYVARTGANTFLGAAQGIMADLVEHGNGVSKRTNAKLGIAPSRQLHNVLPRLKSIQCFAESCVFIKCGTWERRCP